MKISISEKYEHILEEIYSGILLVTKDKEEFGICMRDTGFEFQYNDIWYEAKNGVIRRLSKSQTTIPADATDLEVFHIKGDEAFIGFKVANGNFNFVSVPYTPRDLQYSTHDNLFVDQSVDNSVCCCSPSNVIQDIESSVIGKIDK